MDGFQEGSTMMTRSAAVSVRPKPPTCEVSRKTGGAFPPRWKRATRSCTCPEKFRSHFLLQEYCTLHGWRSLGGFLNTLKTSLRFSRALHLLMALSQCPTTQTLLANPDTGLKDPGLHTTTLNAQAHTVDYGFSAGSLFVMKAEVAPGDLQQS